MATGKTATLSFQIARPEERYTRCRRAGTPHLANMIEVMIRGYSGLVGVVITAVSASKAKR